LNRYEPGRPKGALCACSSRVWVSSSCPVRRGPEPMSRRLRRAHRLRSRAASPKLAKSDSKSKAKKWRSKRKDRAAKKASKPARDRNRWPGPRAPAPLTAAAARARFPRSGAINPVLAAAAVSLPAAFRGGRSRRA